jgi:hypothetical protein
MFVLMIILIFKSQHASFDDLMRTSVSIAQGKPFSRLRSVPRYTISPQPTCTPQAPSIAALRRNDLVLRLLKDSAVARTMVDIELGHLSYELDSSIVIHSHSRETLRKAVRQSLTRPFECHLATNWLAGDLNYESCTPV